MRTHGLSAGELRRLWLQRGEECMLSDGSYLARETRNPPNYLPYRG